MGARRAAFILFASLLFLSGPVSSAEPEIILVTAARTPIPVVESGSSVTVIDAEELQQRQVASVSDILRNVPGLAVSRSGGPGSNTQIRVRGGEANHVLVLIDGIEANDLAQGSEFNFAHLLNHGIERIEVIRGPQSALWGSDAMAGVINIITTRTTDRLAVSGFAEGGSAATGWMGGDLGGASGRVRFGFSGSLLDSGGSNIARTGGEDDGYENGTVSVNATFDPTPDFLLSANLRHTQSMNEYDDIDFVNTGLPVDSDLATDTTQDLGLVQARLTSLGGHWEQVAAGAFTGSDNDNFRDGLEAESSRGRKIRATYQTNLYSDGAVPLNSTQVFSLAAEYEREEFTQRGQETPFGDPNQDLAVDSTALVAEYRLRPESWPSLIVGLRHDANSDFAHATTFRVTTAWAPSRLPGTRIHAAWGEGSKNPTFTERFGFFTDAQVPFIGNPSLTPEHSSGWEAGLDQELFGGSMRWSATWFRERLQDEINGFVFDPVRVAFTAENVDGSSRRQGIELTAGLVLPAGLAITGMYTWLDATQPDDAGSQVDELRRPRHTAALNANYAFAGGRGNLNLNITLTGEQWDTFFPPFPQAPEQLRLESYTVVTLAGAWRVGGNLSLYARVENLLDDNYEEVFGFQGSGIGAFAGIRLNSAP